MENNSFAFSVFLEYFCARQSPSLRANTGVQVYHGKPSSSLHQCWKLPRIRILDKATKELIMTSVWDVHVVCCLAFLRLLQTVRHICFWQRDEKEMRWVSIWIPQRGCSSALYEKQLNRRLSFQLDLFSSACLNLVAYSFPQAASNPKLEFRILLNSEYSRLYTNLTFKFREDTQTSACQSELNLVGNKKGKKSCVCNCQILGGIELYQTP
jgi:hypothetical protein